MNIFLYLLVHQVDEKIYMHQGVMHENFFIPTHKYQYFTDFRNYNQLEAIITTSKFYPNPNHLKSLHFVILHSWH